MFCEMGKVYCQLPAGLHVSGVLYISQINTNSSLAFQRHINTTILYHYGEVKKG